MEAQLLSGYPSEEGDEVTRACDGIDALSQLNTGPLSKTITSIRSDECLRALTLIAVSGNDASTSEMQQARRNVNFWITKRADAERITGAIVEWLAPVVSGICPCGVVVASANEIAS